MGKRAEEEEELVDENEELDEALDDDDDEEIDSGEDIDVTGIMASTLATASRRQRRENARRRLEDLMEEKRAAQELHDLDSYDLDD